LDALTLASGTARQRLSSEQQHLESSPRDAPQRQQHRRWSSRVGEQLWREITPQDAVTPAAAAQMGNQAVFPAAAAGGAPPRLRPPRTGWAVSAQAAPTDGKGPGRAGGPDLHVRPSPRSEWTWRRVGSRDRLPSAADDVPPRGENVPAESRRPHRLSQARRSSGGVEEGVGGAGDANLPQESRSLVSHGGRHLWSVPSGLSVRPGQARQRAARGGRQVLGRGSGPRTVASDMGPLGELLE